MNKKMALMISLITLPLYAGTMGEALAPNPWFATIGSGYSWTQEPGFVNPNPAQWDASVQGYDAPLGNRGFYTFSLGKEAYNYFDVSLSYINNDVFNYQMFQTGTSDTPGFTGAGRTRYLDLNNRAFLLNLAIHPLDGYYSAKNWDFTPFISGGIGYANNQVRNFYTVGTISVDGTAIGSTDSIGNQVATNSFAWQGSIGLNLKPQQSHLSLNVGYRYYNGGTFFGPSIIYANSLGMTDTTPWKGQLQANQAFFEFKYTV